VARAGADVKFGGLAQHIDAGARVRGAVASALENYDVVGLRATDEPYDVDEVLTSSSRRWEDGEPTGDVLRGTSAIRIKSASNVDAALLRLTAYVGAYVLLLGTNSGYEHGEDEGEVVLKRPIVLGVWRRPL